MSETAPFPSSDSLSEQTSNLRVPPHSVEAEQAVIGGLLLDNRAWETIADKLIDEDFTVMIIGYYFQQFVSWNRAMSHSMRLHYLNVWRETVSLINPAVCCI